MLDSAIVYFATMNDLCFVYLPIIMTDNILLVNLLRIKCTFTYSTLMIHEHCFYKSPLVCNVHYSAHWDPLHLMSKNNQSI